MTRGGLIAGFYGALALIALGWGASRGPNAVYRSEQASTLHLLLGPPLGLGLGLLVVFLSRLAVRLFDWARVLHREFHAVVHELSSKEVLLLALASAVGEELFFRGALLHAVGLVPSTLVFSLLHFRLDRRFLPWTAMSFGLGLVFGQMALGLGDLSGPIVAHFVINLMNLSYISRTQLA
jgi:membrane protease YdiL (CAAX protease family)